MCLSSSVSSEELSILFIYFSSRFSKGFGPTKTHYVTFSIVVSAKGIKGAQLHPPVAELVGRVLEKSTDVRSDLLDIASCFHFCPPVQITSPFYCQTL